MRMNGWKRRVGEILCQSPIPKIIYPIVQPFPGTRVNSDVAQTCEAELAEGNGMGGSLVLQVCLHPRSRL